jgi:VWFA-related protein
MRHHVIMRLLSTILLTGLLLPAQQQQPQSPQPQAADPVISVDVNLVNIFASVRDKKGAFLKDLGQPAFSVFEDGKKQDIRYFSQVSNLPLTIGLLVDVSKSQENLIEVEKRAASAFFRQLLRPKDQAFLMSFGMEAELLQDMTGSANILDRGLNALKLSVPVGGVFTPGTTSQPARGTIMFDAVYLAASEQLKGEVGRKVIVLITDGMDYGSRIKIQGAIEAAQKADAIIYSIYYTDPRYSFYGGGNDGDLKKMSSETGGRVFEVSRNRTLQQIFTEIDEEMRSQYTIGYAPANTERDGAFRKVEIRTDNKDHRVAARKGYYAQK